MRVTMLHKKKKSKENTEKASRVKTHYYGTPGLTHTHLGTQESTSDTHLKISQKNYFIISHI